MIPFPSKFHPLSFQARTLTLKLSSMSIRILEEVQEVEYFIYKELHSMTLEVPTHTIQPYLEVQLPVLTAP